MREFFQQLQDSEFSASVLGSESIWAFPTILTLHTVGLAILVGASLVINLRVLGVGSDVPVTRLRVLIRFMWIGFYINLASGTVLFILMAADRARQAMFFYKLGSIALALIFAQIVKVRAFDSPSPSPQMSSGTKLLAAGSILMWMFAIVAGRLMAYVP